MATYMKHSALPQPAIFKHLMPHQDNEALQKFLIEHTANASRFTIDHDNVGRGVVCAYFTSSSEIKGVMLYLKKQEIQRYMEQHSYQCTPTAGSDVIQCVKALKLAKL